MATDPVRQAVWRHVVPLVSQASRFAPSRTSHLTPARFRLAENSSSNRSTSFNSSRVSLKTAPAESQAAASSRSSFSTPCWTVAFGQTPLSLQKSFPLSFPIGHRGLHRGLPGHFRFGHGLWQNLSTLEPMIQVLAQSHRYQLSETTKPKMTSNSNCVSAESAESAESAVCILRFHMSFCLFMISYHHVLKKMSFHAIRVIITHIVHQFQV